MRKILTLVSMTFLISCSNLSKNMIKEGDFSIKNGVYRSHEWDSTLTFKRVSWFHELTLLYDFMYTPIDEKSDFYHWFYEDEKRRIKDCNQVYVTLNYSLDADRISQTMLDSQLREQGLENYLAPQFARTLKIHPDFEHLSLSLYKVRVLCGEKLKNEDIFISFPNFKEIKL